MNQRCLLVPSSVLLPVRRPSPLEFAFTVIRILRRNQYKSQRAAKKRTRLCACNRQQALTEHTAQDLVDAVLLQQVRKTTPVGSLLAVCLPSILCIYNHVEEMKRRKRNFSLSCHGCTFRLLIADAADVYLRLPGFSRTSRTHSSLLFSPFPLSILLVVS
jgi:hypothetical protein